MHKPSFSSNDFFTADYTACPSVGQGHHGYGFFHATPVATGTAFSVIRNHQSAILRTGTPGRT
jgi:hypothetical protein